MKNCEDFTRALDKEMVQMNLNYSPTFGLFTANLLLNEAEKLNRPNNVNGNCANSSNIEDDNLSCQ